MRTGPWCSCWAVPSIPTGAPRTARRPSNCAGGRKNWATGTVSWSEGADSLDWATVKEFNLYRSGQAIIQRLEKRMKKQDGDGLIVLMHLGSLRPYLDRPATYLGPFLDRAQAEGWHFVCIGDYLKAMGRPVWEPSRRMARIQQGAAPDSP